MIINVNLQGFKQDKSMKKNFGIVCSIALAMLAFSACDDSSSASDDRQTKTSSSSSIVSATSCKDCEYGTLTDSRDGQTYKTIVIGTQTWMAENLNFETEESYCLDDDAVNCSKYGRLYKWAAAMDGAGTWTSNGKGCGYDVTCSPIYPVRGICPEGWHLPDTTEFK